MNWVIKWGCVRYCCWYVKFDCIEGLVVIVYREFLFLLCFGNYWLENNWWVIEVGSVLFFEWGVGFERI